MEDMESAARILQGMICEAFCSPNRLTRSKARNWLLLNREPTDADYNKNSFIEICSLLKLDWRWLKGTLLIGIGTEIEDLKNVRHLRLVHSSEHKYNRKYEKNFNSDRASATKKG